MKNYILTILLFFFSLTIFSENKLAIVSSPEGFIFIRSGQGYEYKIVDTLYIDDFFYFQFVDNSEWAKVTVWKGRQIEGYIHKSSIIEVEKLDKQKQKELLANILHRQKVLGDNFQSAWKSKDSLAYRTTRRDLEYYSETKYDPILDILPKYFCLTNDVEILNHFFATMWADRGSANENPSSALGRCFSCNPNLVIEQLTKVKNIEQKKMIIDYIEWGLLNNFNVSENGNSDNKEFIELKTQLDNVKK
jgi:hypothetical protein